MMPTLTPEAWLWKGLVPSVQITQPHDMINKHWTPMYSPEYVSAAYRAGVLAGAIAEKQRMNRLNYRSKDTFSFSKDTFSFSNDTYK